MTRNNALQLNTPSPALLTLIGDFSQVITLDANILLIPERSEVRSPVRFEYGLHEKYWLNSLFRTFPHLAVHDAVRREILIPAVLVRYLDDKINRNRLILLQDSDFAPDEEVIRSTIERKIARYTNYNPVLDLGQDKGEVKSLAHMATRGYLYFCSADANALRLIDYADTYDTNLDQQHALRYYELIYYLHKVRATPSQYLKAMYKNSYRLTSLEKTIHPEWGEFCKAMDALYKAAFMESNGLPSGMHTLL